MKAIGLMPRLGNGQLFAAAQEKYIRDKATSVDDTLYPTGSLDANWYYYDAVWTMANAVQNVRFSSSYSLILFY